jgi:hypothetical protein
MGMPATPKWSVFSVTTGGIDISPTYPTKEEAELAREHWLAGNQGTAVVLPHVSWDTATRWAAAKAAYSEADHFDKG